MYFFLLIQPCVGQYLCCGRSTANVLSEQGKTDEALAMYRNALAIDEKIHGLHHPIVADTKNKYAALPADSPLVVGLRWGVDVGLVVGSRCWASGGE